MNGRGPLAELFRHGAEVSGCCFPIAPTKKHFLPDGNVIGDADASVFRVDPHNVADQIIARVAIGHQQADMQRQQQLAKIGFVGANVGEVFQKSLEAISPSSVAMRCSWISVISRTGPIAVQPCETPVVTPISGPSRMLEVPLCVTLPATWS